MNILFISSNFYPKKGGVEVVLEHIADQLAKTHRIKVISSTLNARFNPISMLKNAVEEKHNGYKIKRVWMGCPGSLLGMVIFPVRLILSYFRLSKAINEFKPDVVNYHFPDDSSLYVFLYLIFNKINLITNIHGNDIQVFARKFFHRIFIGVVLNKSKNIIVNSSYMKDILVQEYPEINDKIIIIHNGIEYNNIQQIKPKRFCKEPYLMLVARMVHKKGVDVLLNAFSMVKSKDLKLVIEGNGEELDKMLELRGQLDLDDVVFFTKGELLHQEKFAYLKQAEFGVMPSRIEPFGVVAIEMLACGLPIVASKTGGLAEIIKENECGLFFENENSGGLASKIDKLHSDSRLREKLKEGAIKESKKYAWSNIISEYEEVFISSLQE